MIAKSFATFALLALASAAPPRPSKSSCAPKPTSAPGGEPALPINGGAKELAAPPAGQKLKHIALGLGYQNYTCDAVGATGKSAGALAFLYDIKPLYPGQSRDSLSLEGWLSLSTTAAYTAPIPLNVETKTDGRQPNSEPPASATNPFKAPSPLDLSKSGIKKRIEFSGLHWFDSAGVPTFKLGNDLIRSAKNDSIPAPPTASPGEDGGAAVAWLLLTSVEGSVGLKTVYRVATVGGSPHACVNVGTDSAIYGAIYYLYG